MSAVDWDALKDAAERARANAYAPYSEFRVGAALLTDDGTVIIGANVENASYGLSLCAERSAVGAAVADGHRHFRAIALASSGPDPVTPCGMCRQVLNEFPPSFEVRSFATGERFWQSTVASMLPDAFGRSDLER